jgi:hydroxyacylglutathione hydrolase
VSLGLGGRRLEVTLRDDPRAGRDYPPGCWYQPDEPPLQMTVAQLTAVRYAARSVAGRPGAHRFHAFLICNGPCRHYLVPLSLRSLRARITLSR